MMPASFSFMLIFAEQTHISPVTWQPVVSPFIVCALVAILAFITFKEVVGKASAGRRVGSSVLRSLIILRLVSTGILCMILLNPTIEFVRPGEAHEDSNLDVTIIFDASESMCIADVHLPDSAAPVGRLNAAGRYWLDSAFARQLSSLAAIHTYTLAEHLAPADIANMTANGAATHVRRGLQSLLAQPPSTPQSTVILISDGRDTSTDDFDVEDATSLGNRAAESGITIHTVCLGGSTRQPDISTSLVCDQPFVFRGQPTTLRGTIDQTGFDGQIAQAGLLQNGTLIESRTITLSDNSKRQRLTIAVTPEVPTDSEHEVGYADSGALCTFELRVQPLAGEVRTANNTAHSFVRISNEHIRIVLFENEPYWDTRFLIGTLRNDEQVDLTVITGLGRSEQLQHFAPNERDGTSNAPAGVSVIPNTHEQLYTYDIVILGHGTERWFGGSEGGRLLYDYVTKRGGALVLSRGMPFDLNTANGRLAKQQLDAISPVTWGRELWRHAGGSLVRPTDSTEPNLPIDLSALGNTDAILTSLPGMIAQTVIEKERALSSVWLRSEQRDRRSQTQMTPKEQRPAALAHLAAGRGQVLAVLTDGMWQWELLPEYYGDLNAIYDLFWQRTVRWLVGQADLLPGQSVGLSVRHLSMKPGQTQQILIRTRFIAPDRFQPHLTITTPDGITLPLSATLIQPSTTETADYEALFQPEGEGVYTVSLDQPPQPADRAGPPHTIRFVVDDPSIELIDTSARPDVMAALAEASGGLVIPYAEPDTLLSNLNDLKTARRLISSPTEAWHQPWIFAVLIASLAAEWISRRRAGLP